MLGFVIGTVCVIGLVKMLRRGHSWHQGPFGRSACGRSHPFANPRRWMLRRLFERLETMPGQERAIVQAVDRLAESRPAVRDELKQTREDLARVVASGFVDDGSLEETFARHDRLLAQLRVSFVETLKATTETLDERQRKELARLITGGLFGARAGWGGPHEVWA